MIFHFTVSDDFQLPSTDYHTGVPNSRFDDILVSVLTTVPYLSIVSCIKNNRNNQSALLGHHSRPYGMMASNDLL